MSQEQQHTDPETYQLDQVGSPTEQLGRQSQKSTCQTQESYTQTYKDAGVDTAEGARAVEAIKADVAKTSRPEVIGGLGDFGSCFSIAAAKNMKDPVLISGTDGVGTKLAIAQLLDRHTTVGQDLVAMCVDDIVCAGAEPLFFLDYIAVGKLKAEHVAQVLKGIAAACKASGCALIGGEMAEHPGVMNPTDYDLAGFVVGLVDRGNMLGAHRVSEGDVILGIPSSGLHSNGYSLVRKVLIENRSIGELTAAQASLNGQSIADAVLEPTIIYAGKILAALRAGAPIHALAHITGGGITENLDRVLAGTLDAEITRGTLEQPAWKIPPIIQAAVKAANLSIDQAFSTFNMGVGMCVLVDSADVEQIQQTLAAHDLETFVMGHCVPGSGKVRYV